MSIIRSNKQDINLFEFHELNKPRKFIRGADLKPVNNLKHIFREVRDYFAGNVTGITRDEKIAQNIMRLLFCKIYDEKNCTEITNFSNRPEEDLSEFYSRVTTLFENVKTDYSDIFEKDEVLEIPAADLSFIVSKMEEYSILEADRDVIADAFEELIGTAFRGGEGQFFTPRNVVQMMIDVLQPRQGERILDPACGSGGFLSYTLRCLIKNKAKDFYLVGIDKDAFLAKIAKIYLSLLGDQEYHVFCENSLENPTKWKKETQLSADLDTFDVILTNPPFGSKIPVVGRDLLKQYKIGHQWDVFESKWFMSKKLRDKQPPQVLFIERCIQFLKEDGRLGIVLPEGIFGNPSDKYIWEFISQECSVLGVVSLAQETFQPSTHTKTSVLFLQKNTHKPISIFMAIANNIGHNKNGKPIYKMRNDGAFLSDNNGHMIINDDLPEIATRFNDKAVGKSKKKNHLGFFIANEDINDYIYIPEYYNPEIREELVRLKNRGKYDLISVGELVQRNFLQIKRGNEIGSHFYGTGDIPFVRTSDIVNWEIKFDPVKSVSEEVFNQYSKGQDIQENDILFVNDGTFLIGRTALVTRLDLKIIIQSHIRKIRSLDYDVVNPFYLFYLLNSKIVRKQIDAKTFVQATISTIGNRLGEVILPVSNNKKEIVKTSKDIEDIIRQKENLRERTIKIVEGSV